MYLPPADARAAFERGAVDAWVIWDPYQAAAETQLQARTLTDATGLADNHQFYLATRSFAKAHPEQVGAIVDEVRSVGEWAKAHPDQVAAQVAPLLNLPLDTAERVVKRQGYGARFISPEVAAQQQKIADAFTALKLIPKPLVIRDVVWTPPASLQTAAAKP